MPKNIIFSGKLGDDFVLGTPSGFYLYNPGMRVKQNHLPLCRSRSGRNEINCYYIDNDDNIWIGTKGSGLFLKTENGRNNSVLQIG